MPTLKAIQGRELIWNRHICFGGLWEIGMGVNVSDVSRIRDSFTDMQIRNELSGLAEWDVQSELLRQVEDIFNEPTDIGVSAVLNRFWESLETLSNDAGSPKQERQ